MLRLSLFGKKILVRFGFFMTLTCLFLIARSDLTVCLCCCLLHECGHLLICLLRRLPVKELEFCYCGLKLRLKENYELLSVTDSVLLHGGGIAANLMFAGVFALLGACGLPVMEWCCVNLCLAGFHAIPAADLDGGRVWLACGECFLPPETLSFWEGLGQGIAFLIFIGFAVAALRADAPETALMAGVFALCCMRLPNK